jgi:hypothetical protein
LIHAQIIAISHPGLQATTVMVGNTSYFKLLLDINQSNSHPLLSLDQLQFSYFARWQPDHDEHQLPGDSALFIQSG